MLSGARELSGTNPHGFDDLFSLGAADELLSRRGLRTPFLRMAKDGVVTPPARYTRSGGAGAAVADQVADDRVLELFADGHTVVFQGLHRVWPPLVDFAGALGSDLGHPVQVNSYVTPSSSRGFAAHYDVHDVFVLQVAGEKRWRVHAPVHPAPLRDQPWSQRVAAVAASAQQLPLLEAVLRPGDALYLPRGFLHAAEALGAVSCHLTVGVHPVTRHHLLETLLALLADDQADLRASLPMGLDLADPASVEPDLAATVAALTARLATVTAAEVTNHLARSLLASNRPEPVGPLAQAAALAGLDSDTALRARRHLRHTLAFDDDDGVVLRLADRTVRLPADTATAVRALLDGTVLRVGELPGLEPADALVLARRLVREAVVVVEGR